MESDGNAAKWKQPGWTLIDLADGRQALWSDATGRHMPFSPSLLGQLEGTLPMPPVVSARLLDLANDFDDRSRRIVFRSWWCLFLPDKQALWVPVPHARTAGGVPFRLWPLTPAECAIQAAIDDRRTVADIARVAGSTVDAVLAHLRPLQRPDVQAVQLRLSMSSARDRSLAHLVLPVRPDGARRADQITDGATSLGQWHEDGIVDASVHFDDVETTFAHAFEAPHAALRGQAFGAVLLQRLLEKADWPREKALSIAEVGPGTGAVAEAALAFCSERGQAVERYVRVDRSPVLLAAQNARVPASEGRLGDASALPLADASVDLLVSNEVIADLPAVPVDDPSIAPWSRVLDLRDVPPGQWVNRGAWELVREAARVVRPGGWVYLSEFGALDEVPTETRHLDHPEVSIHFGQLVAVANALGFDAEVVPLAELLDVDMTARWLSRPSWEGLRALFHAGGGTVEARAWTCTSAPHPTRVVGLRDVPLTEDGPAPVISRVLALVGRRRRTDTASPPFADTTGQHPAMVPRETKEQ